MSSLVCAERTAGILALAFRMRCNFLSCDTVVNSSGIMVSHPLSNYLLFGTKSPAAQSRAIRQHVLAVYLQYNEAELNSEQVAQMFLRIDYRSKSGRDSADR